MNCPKTVWHGTTILLTSSFLRSGIQRGFHDLWGLSWRNSRPGMTRQLGQELSGGIVIHIPGVWCCQVGPQLGLSAGAPTSGLSCLSFLTAGFGVPKVSVLQENHVETIAFYDLALGVTQCHLWYILLGQVSHLGQPKLKGILSQLQKCTKNCKHVLELLRDIHVDCLTLLPNLVLNVAEPCYKWSLIQVYDVLEKAKLWWQ